MMGDRAPRRIGIMGGTFDPIHFGHLHPAQAAAAAFSLDKVLFVPSGQPPHKRGRNITPKEHRFAMTVLATAGNPLFEVSRIELDRKGPSFSIDTIRELREAYPKAGFHFITGMDAILDIFTWKDWTALFDLCEFIVAARPGHDPEAFHDQLAQCGASVEALVRPRVHLMEVPLLQISSSGIRKAAAEGLPFRYLLPDPVHEYAVKHGLYAPRD